MTFACRCCGDCCSTMGEIIAIREQIGPGRFRIGFTDGEERTVVLDPGRDELFGIAGDNTKKSAACPFLRPDGHGRRICIVHDSRPAICRGYLCSRILVLDDEGNRAGRVLPGTRILSTTDRRLLGIWNSRLRDIAITGENGWEHAVEDIFLQEGYRVLR